MSGAFATSAIVIKLITDEYNRRTLEQGKVLPVRTAQKKKARCVTSNASIATEGGHAARALRVIVRVSLAYSHE